MADSGNCNVMEKVVYQHVVYFDVKVTTCVTVSKLIHSKMRSLTEITMNKLGGKEAFLFLEVGSMKYLFWLETMLPNF